MTYGTFPNVGSELEERVRARVTGIATSSTAVMLPVDATITARTVAQESAAPAATAGELPRITLEGGAAVPAGAIAPAKRADLQLLRTLGEGGMGRVQLARQRSLGREVAVKSLKDDAGAGAREALLAEARITGSLEHPGVIPVHALGVDDGGRPLLVMKRVEGVEWQTLLRDHEHELWETRQARDRLTANLEILIQICQTVEFAHARGVIHRDIKPENVMIGAYGEVYLVDWGIALEKRHAAAQASVLVGTPAFMAPEMALGKLVDEHTDVYLLGATLHYVLAGTYRHDGDTLQAVLCAAALSEPHEYPPSVPEALGAICNRATAADPAARFASVQELRLALSDFLQRRSANALVESAEQRSRELDRALAGGGVPSELSTAYQLVSAARFGFAQALRDYPGHERAESGARRALLAAIELELRQDHARSARALLEELADPEPELVQRIEASEARALEREQQADRLKAFEHDKDASVGHAARSTALILVGVLVLGISAFVAFGPGYGGVTPGRMLLIGLVITLAMFTGVFTLRRSLMLNAFNRRLTILLVAAVVGSLGNRVLGFVFDTEVAAIATAELLLLAGITVGGATCLARGMWASVALLGAAFVYARARPEVAIGIFSGASVLNVFLLVLALWYEARRVPR